MNAKLFVKEKGGCVNIHIEPNDAIYIKDIDTYRLMEEYHQDKLKLLNMPVVGQQRELLEAFADYLNKSFPKTIDLDYDDVAHFIDGLQ